MRDINDDDGETLRQQNPKPKSEKDGKTPISNLSLADN